MWKAIFTPLALLGMPVSAWKAKRQPSVRAKTSGFITFDSPSGLYVAPLSVETTASTSYST